MLIEFLKPDFIFENDTGSLKQLVHDGWKQVNIIVSNAGWVRGRHYHKFNSEAFYIISGTFKLTVWRGKETEYYELNQGEMFVIPPYVFHTFEYHTDTILVSLYSNGVELTETDKDIWIE